MKFLVLGSNGMAGHMIALYLLERGHEVIGLARQEGVFPNTIICDVMDGTKCKKVIEETAPDVVVNAIGILNRAVDENLARGIYINSYFPHMIAPCCDAIGARFVHISTDCVFSGKKGSYTEADIPDETSSYGRTKWLGEVTEGNHLTIRTSIIGPELKNDGIGLFHWFMREQGSVNGFTNVYWSGVTTLELARAIESAVQQEVSGLLFLSNNKKISKCDLLTLIKGTFGLLDIDIIPDGEMHSDKSLICTRTDFTFVVKDYQVMIEELKEWMDNHYTIYRGIYK